ncbi:hypothetical protein DYB32_005410 [Aphanomyces invadans]|uniref:Uncharacterized protein n=1 Tax=Aphanomyces invadans TaxID=157072 RepID=A0A3R6YY69_9STRA|nr:hypothetical protein DYB32_005410 [Aphanomyces invadans]
MARNNTTKDDTQVAKKKDGAKNSKQNAKHEAVVDFASIDHPYVVVLNKKLRSFKKKQEKIKALEDSLRGQTKQLNEQQLEVLSNKGFVDKMVVELDTLRQQFVDTVLANTPSTEAKTVEETKEILPSEDGDVSSLNHLNEDVSDGGKDPVDDLEDEDKAASVNSVTFASNAASNSIDLDEEKLEFVHSILKLLHAVSLHQALGHDVPMALDYFVKVLVGVTRPPAEVSFPENLAESLEEAKRYVLKSDKILACDMSYRQLSEAVDHLVAPRPPVQKEVLEVVPQINFFTESELDKDTTLATTSVDATHRRGDDESFVVVDVVDKPAPVPHSSKPRPYSGNRRNKNSPREGPGDHDKERKPRKVYQPRNKGPIGEQPNEQNSGNSRNAAPPRANPKAVGNDGEKQQRPTTSRRSNKQGGDRPRPKKVEQDVSP